MCGKSDVTSSHKGELECKCMIWDGRKVVITGLIGLLNKMSLFAAAFQNKAVRKLLRTWITLLSGDIIILY